MPSAKPHLLEAPAPSSVTLGASFQQLCHIRKAPPTTAVIFFSNQSNVKRFTFLSPSSPLPPGGGLGLNSQSRPCSASPPPLHSTVSPFLLLGCPLPPPFLFSPFPLRLCFGGVLFCAMFTLTDFYSAVSAIFLPPFPEP